MNTAPYIPGSATSKAAAESMAPHLEPLQIAVMDVFKHYGALTDSELAGCFVHFYPWTMRLDSTIRARRIKLTHMGKLVDSGEKRCGASGRMQTVWKLAT